MERGFLIVVNFLPRVFLLFSPNYSIFEFLFSTRLTKAFLNENISAKDNHRTGQIIITFLQKNTVDVIFLDIEMEGFTGLQLIHALHRKPKIVLTTAYDQYALKAFDLNVSDYILKPISFERFIQSIDKLFDLFVQEKPPDTSAN